MRKRRKLLFSMIALLLAFLLAEVGTKVWLHWVASEASVRRYASYSQLRARLGAFDRYHSHRHLGYALAPNFRRGADRHNALGFRGDEITLAKPEGVTRIVCCGGSTTYGFSIDDYHFAMPGLLQYGLREAGKPNVEVVNAGCPGWSSFETMLNLSSRVLDLDPDYVVFYHGINDVLASMVWPPTALRGDQSGWLVRSHRMAEASFAERSDLLRLLMVRTGMIEPHSSMLRVIGEPAPSNYTLLFRQQRLAGSYPDGIFREVPIERMLRTNGTRLFERNLDSFIAIAKQHGVRVLLTTFAYSGEFLGMPNIGHPAVCEAIDACNAIVRERAQAEDVDLIDLQPELTQRELFTDGEHFTLLGNARRVELMLPYFLARLP